MEVEVSWVKFVNAATRKRTAFTRASSSAIDETSIATVLAPRLRMSAMMRASSSASGVVWVVAKVSSPKRFPMVPTMPHAGLPWTPSTASRTRCVVVVLPLVPVMPTTSSEKVGCP